MKMTSESGRQTIGILNGVEGYGTDGILTHPFICGICTEKFDQLWIFIHHFKTHSTHCKQNLHVCKCLYAGDLDTDTEKEDDLYKCRICNGRFTSICALHTHILHCSSDGSYIFDNTRKMVYPLTLHCSYFETRGENSEGIIEESVDLNENNDSGINADCSSDALSKAEKVDYILRNVCTLYGNNENKELRQKKNVEIKRQKKKVQRKRRPTKCDCLISATNSSTLGDEKRKKRSDKNAVIETKEDKGGHQESEKDEEQVESTSIEKDHVVVKVEIEEKMSSDFGISQSIGSERENDYCGEKVPDKHDRFDDDDDDLTDEYIPQDENDIKRKVSPAKKAKPVKLKNKKSPRKVTNCQRKQNSVEECPHCGKWLKPYKLKIHLVSHTEDRPYKCEQCPKAYKYQSHLESHKHAHQEVKPFYCEKCGKGYTTITMLKHHSMMHHADSKPCVCSICGASFITNYKLKRHMMKHTGEKCVQCDLCGMGFATRYNLSVHIQGVHKKNLRFTCKECGRNFMTNYQHKVHMMKHSGERPFKCIICRAEYIERKELRRHLKKQHNLLLEGNSNILSGNQELMEGCISEKLNISKLEQDGSTFSHQTYSQAQEQSKTGTAEGFIAAENEDIYPYPSADICQSAQYYPSMKSAGEITDLKTLPTSDYHLGYPHSQGYSFHNSSVNEGVPLTVQETPDNSQYNYTLSDNSMAKDLSKGGGEKFEASGSSKHNMPTNHHVNQDKNRTEMSHDKIDRKFTVL